MALATPSSSAPLKGTWRVGLAKASPFGEGQGPKGGTKAGSQRVCMITRAPVQYTTCLTEHGHPQWGACHCHLQRPCGGQLSSQRGQKSKRPLPGPSLPHSLQSPSQVLPGLFLLLAAPYCWPLISQVHGAWGKALSKADFPPFYPALWLCLFLHLDQCCCLQEGLPAYSAGLRQTWLVSPSCPIDGLHWSGELLLVHFSGPGAQHRLDTGQVLLADCRSEKEAVQAVMFPTPSRHLLCSSLHSPNQAEVQVKEFGIDSLEVKPCHSWGTLGRSPGADAAYAPGLLSLAHSAPLPEPPSGVPN